MGFGNIGIGELMMILLVVMIIFGPKRLPEIARNMGKFMRDFRRETNAAIKELKDGIEPIKVGIFDEPDAAAGAVVDNGSPGGGRVGPLPGVAAAGGAGAVAATTAPEDEGPGNGARKKAGKRKPAAARATRARSKRPSSTTRAKTPAAKKRAAAKPRSSPPRARATRKR